MKKSTRYLIILYVVSLITTFLISYVSLKLGHFGTGYCFFLINIIVAFSPILFLKLPEGNGFNPMLD